MSKYYMDFKKRVDKFYVDCELVEYLCDFHPLLANSKGKGLELKNKKKRYPNLAIVDSSYKRKEILNHLCRTVYSSFIKDLYEEVCLYISTILAAMALNHKISNIERLVEGCTKNICIKDLLNYSSYEEVVNLISKTITRTMEEHQMWCDEKKKKNIRLSIIDELQKRLGISFDINKKNEAEHYLCLRHILVHNDGYPDSDFIEKHPVFKLKKGQKKLPMTHIIIQNAYETVNELVLEIDNCLVNNNLI